MFRENRNKGEASSFISDPGQIYVHQHQHQNLVATRNLPQISLRKLVGDPNSRFCAKMLYFNTSCGGSKTETKLSLIRKEWSVYHFVCIIIIRVPIFVVFSRAILCVQLSCVYHFVRGVARFFCQGGPRKT